MQVFQLGALEGILLAQPPKERLLREIMEIGELEHCIKPLSSFIGWDNCTGHMLDHGVKSSHPPENPTR